MRVIAGAYKGRRLVAPKGLGTRPTSDRVREALFSILGARVQDAVVLDLFAGSGALGIEALSRGAERATFVESDAAAIRALERNTEGIDGVEIERADARMFARSALQSARQYDLVFLDPPYRRAQALAGELAEAVAALLAPGGLVVAESDRRAPLELPAIPLQDERRYGDTLIRIHAAQS